LSKLNQNLNISRAEIVPYPFITFMKGYGAISSLDVFGFGLNLRKGGGGGGGQ
jgi:hypothetical protein